MIALQRLLCKQRRREAREVRKWERAARPAPPPHLIKQEILKTYQKRFGLKVLVETGTHHGDMVEATKHVFDEIYSIELSFELFEKATARFQSDPHIHIIHGDSGEKLGPIVEPIVDRIDRPALFWLDGHYSGGDTARGDKDTPIVEELHHILNAKEKRHVALIDDARCFGTEPSYPSIDELTAIILSERFDVSISVEDDIMRVVP
jgi:hypothetical protein